MLDYDDDTEPCEDDDTEPCEDDYILSDAGRLGSLTAVSQNGRHLGTFREEDEAEQFIRGHAQNAQFWPNVWRLSDHGNYHPRENFIY